MAARSFLVPINLNQLELQNAAVQNLASAPSTPVKGQLYYDTVANILYWWDGTTWQSAKGGGAGLTLSTTVTADTTFGAASNAGAAGTASKGDHSHGSPTHLAADHSTIPISALGTAAGTINMGNSNILNVAGPLNPSDAATKGYVDGVAQGLSWKSAVRVATTVAGTLASSFANGQVVDGITLATGDRLLIKNQATGGENGIYTVNASGAPTRATDNDVSAEFTSAACFVQSGTTNADTAWVNTTDQPITVGTTATVWVQFTGAQSLNAGAGLTSTGNTVNFIGDATMNVQADILGVQRGAANGRVPILYANTITGTGAATAFTVTHNLAISSTDVIIQVYDLATLAQVDVDVVATNTNTATLNFATAPANGKTYRVVCYG